VEAFHYRPQLDGIRAIAVLGVVAFHSRGGAFPGGYIGVDVFFVLSGYLITTLLMAEHASTGRVSFRRFYARRALRLLPALVLVCGITALMWALVPNLPDHRDTLYGTLAALTYTSSVVAAGGVSHLGVMLPTWSLSVEEYFYLLWPVALACLIALNGRSRWIVGGSLVLAAISYRWWSAWGAGWDIQRISYGADTRAEQLLLGCALAAALPMLRYRIGTAAATVGAILLGAFVVWPGDLPSEFYFHGGSTILALTAAVLIAHTSQQPDSPFSRVLSARPLAWIGQRSYGIYLWHVPLIALVAATHTSSIVQLVVKLVLVFLLPALSYRYLETPFLRVKRRLGAAPAPPRAASGLLRHPAVTGSN
jgi:peptidoglycan/LPS O-acetylase OafA/YrhL